jgi:hypothetical protein
MTPDMYFAIFQLGVSVFRSIKAHHDAGKGASDGDLINGALSALDEADQIKLKILANAGLPIDIKTTDQLIDALQGEPVFFQKLGDFHAPPNS